MKSISMARVFTVMVVPISGKLFWCEGMEVEGYLDLITLVVSVWLKIDCMTWLVSKWGVHVGSVESSHTSHTKPLSCIYVPVELHPLFERERERECVCVCVCVCVGG